MSETELTRITIRLTKHQIDLLRQYCAPTGGSYNYIIRQAVSEFLERHKEHAAVPSASTSNPHVPSTVAHQTLQPAQAPLTGVVDGNYGAS